MEAISWTCQAAIRLPQLSLAFKELDESIPLWGALLDVGLHLLVIDELDGIAVIQIVFAINQDLSFHLSIAKNQVVEDATVPQTDKTADFKQEMVAQLDADFVEWLQTLVKWLLLVHIFLESDFACVQIVLLPRTSFRIGRCRKRRVC